METEKRESNDFRARKIAGGLRFLSQKMRNHAFIGNRGHEFNLHIKQG